MLARALDRGRVTGVGVTHHAGRGIVPKHPRDALVGFRRAVTDDHQACVLRETDPHASTVMEAHPRRAARGVE